MSNHATPIVPTVLSIAEQRHPWKLAALTRLTTSYHTPTTVRLMPGGITKHQHQVYCIPDDDAWGRVIFTQSALQTDLNALADGLRSLGSYASRLAKAGGMKSAPNPLCATVIRAPDPDTADEGYWFTNQLVPRIERAGIRGHTPKMLRDARYSDGSVFAQRDHFVCPDDAAWEKIAALIAAAEDRARAWEALLKELGTYSEALGDGRYTRKEAFMQTTTLIARPGVRPASSWGATDLDSAFVGQLESKGYHWEHAKQTPDGRWHHVISSRNTALLRNDQVLMRRERLEALLAPVAALTTTEQPITAVPMMDAAEARETLDAMRGDLGQIELSLSSFRRRALDFADRQGWKAMGYAGALEAINAELGAQYSKSYLSRLLGAARIEKILELPIGNSVPETQLRPLASLDTPDQQRQAWQAATAATNGKPTTGAVQQAVQAIKPARPNAPAGWVWRDNNSLRCIADGRIVGPYARLADVVSAAEQMDRERADQQHLAAVEQIIKTLDQWADSERPARIQEAYGHARPISTPALRDQAFTRIDAVVEGRPATPPASVPMTPESRDADGPWFWASKSAVHPTAHCWHKSKVTSGYVSACGLEAAQQPTSGAKGFHCGVCETHADRREIIPIPGTGPSPITIHTSSGPQTVTPIAVTGVLAQHESNGRFVLTHVPTDKAIASFARHSNAGRAMDQLANLDWTLTSDHSVGPELGLAITRIVTQFEDVDNYDLRRAKLAELEAKAAPAQPADEPPSMPDVPADWEAHYDHAHDLACKALEYADGSTRFYSLAKAVTTALELASHLAGEKLEDLVEQLDDATYEALAAYRRDRTVPTLESEGIV